MDQAAVCGRSDNLFGSNLKGMYANANRSADPCVSYGYTSKAAVAMICYWCTGADTGTTQTLYLDDFRVPVTKELTISGIYIWATGASGAGMAYQHAGGATTTQQVMKKLTGCGITSSVNMKMKGQELVLTMKAETAVNQAYLTWNDVSTGTKPTFLGTSEANAAVFTCGDAVLAGAGRGSIVKGAQ
jgi:hypothetical protein